MPNESKPMDHFLHIDVNAAQAMMEQKQAHLVDIRDPQSFQLAHAKNAYHLTNQSMVQFMEQAEFDQPVLVMCYHGISSQAQPNIWLTKDLKRCIVSMAALKPGTVPISPSKRVND